MDQRFLIPMPLAEKPAADGGGLGIYIDTEGKRLYWSASFPLPKIAERVISSATTARVARQIAARSTSSVDTGWRVLLVWCRNRIRRPAINRF